MHLRCRRIGPGSAHRGRERAPIAVQIQTARPTAELECIAAAGHITPLCRESSTAQSVAADFVRGQLLAGLAGGLGEYWGLPTAFTCIFNARQDEIRILARCGAEGDRHAVGGYGGDLVRKGPAGSWFAEVRVSGEFFPGLGGDPLVTYE